MKEKYYDSDAQAQRSVASVGNWMWTLLLSAIPVVNLISLIVFTIHSKKPSKKNWAIANITWMMIAYVIGILLSIAAVVFVVYLINNVPISELMAQIETSIKSVYPEFTGFSF